MSTPFRCYVIGNESLAIQCADILIERGHAVLGVVSSDEGIARWAEQKEIPRIAPGKGLAERLRANDADVDWIFSIANLAILPPEVIALAKKGAINFHDGPLPRYAGLNAPMWAILNGEREHGITWHLIEGGVDEGDVLAQRTFPLGERDTSVIVNTRCWEAAIESFPGLVDQLARREETRTKQDLSRRTYHGKHERPAACCTVDWSRPASEIARLVRALDFGPRYASPVGAAKAIAPGGEPILLREVAEGAAESEHAPGTVVRVEGGALEVATGRGTLRFPIVTCPAGSPRTDEQLAAIGIVAGARLPSLDADRATALSTIDRELAPHEAFWSARLAAATPIELPYAERAATTKAPSYVRAPFPVPAGLDADGAIAAALAWLARITGQHAFDVGWRHAGIASATRGLEPLFARTVPLRVEVGEATTFAELRAQIAERRAQARTRGTHARDLVARTPGLAAPRLEIAIEETDAPEVTRPGGEVLEIALSPDGRRAALIVDTTRVAAGHVERMVARLGTLMQGAAEDASRPVSRLPLLPADELDRVLRQWNATGADYPADKCVHQLFEAQVDRTPDRRALAFEAQALTYRELDARASQLAHHLVALGVGPGALVGLHLDRSPELVIAALAIWKAGGAYVPVDPAYPADRVKLYLEDSRAKVVVTRERLAAGVTTGAAIVRVDADAAAIAARPTSRLEARATSSDLAYVIYTSGSTGTPKGVMVEHSNVANFFAGMDPVIPRPSGATWLAVTSLSFDISVLELFYTLARGFTVVLSSDEDRALVASGRAAHLDRRVGFSLFYFASDEGEKNADKYRLLIEGAKFADRNGFAAVWTPERHFGAFGGLYPNPSVAAAAIAAVTKHVGIRAGSCVIPLHHPIRVAEEWALVDNLSHGRVGISFASGWHPNDFVLRPESFADPKKAMLRDVELVRRLWRGEEITFPGPKGDVAVRTLPRPIQRELPIWLTAAGNPETFAAAARAGAGILTHLLGQSVDEVREKIAVYRRAWKEAGHAGEGHVTLMLHTFVGDDEATVRETARGPMKDYLRSAMSLIAQHAWAFPAFKRHAKEGASFEDNFASLSPEDAEALLDHAFERYYETSGLFGTPETAMKMVARCKEIGVDEIACLIDYGIDSDTVLAHLEHLDRLRLAAEPRPRVEADDWSIAAQIARHGVTHLQCTPSMLRMLLANDEARAALASVKHLYVGGEALPGALVADVARATRATVTNMYGPTETTIWSSTEVASSGAATVPLGRPIANTQLYVLDAARQPVPIGAPGELWIGGAGVARGYLHRDELTAERFVADPFSGVPGARMYRTGDRVRWLGDGRVDFLGRVDHQVKIRGHRIELGEIESRLASRAELREVVVVAREDVPGDARLVAYYTARPGASPDPEALRAHLRAALPEVMVPSHFVELARFPLTPNAKIDRKQLPVPDASAGRTSAAPHVDAESDIERQIAEIWKRILGLGKVGTRDNFFELGGHSLLAVQAHREIKQATGKDLSITDIFRFPTIASLATHLGAGGEVAGASEARDDAADRAAQRREAMSRRAAAVRKR